VAIGDDLSFALPTTGSVEVTDNGALPPESIPANGKSALGKPVLTVPARRRQVRPVALLKVSGRSLHGWHLGGSTP